MVYLSRPILRFSAVTVLPDELVEQTILLHSQRRYSTDLEISQKLFRYLAKTRLSFQRQQYLMRLLNQLGVKKLYDHEWNI